MYEFRRASKKELEEIIELYGPMDMNLEYYPQIFVLIKAGTIKSYSLVNIKNYGPEICFIKDENLDEDEMDLIIKSLFFILSEKYSVIYSKEPIEKYTIKEGNLNRIYIKRSCGNA